MVTEDNRAAEPLQALLKLSLLTQKHLEALEASRSYAKTPPSNKQSAGSENLSRQ